MTTSQNQGEEMKFKAENLAETPEKLGLNDGPMGQKTWKPFRSYCKTMEKLWKKMDLSNATWNLIVLSSPSRIVLSRCFMHEDWSKRT